MKEKASLRQMKFMLGMRVLFTILMVFALVGVLMGKTSASYMLIVIPLTWALSRIFSEGIEAFLLLRDLSVQEKNTDEGAQNTSKDDKESEDE